jgi:hypothetical protein
VKSNNKLAGADFPMFLRPYSSGSSSHLGAHVLTPYRVSPVILNGHTSALAAVVGFGVRSLKGIM